MLILLLAVSYAAQEKYEVGTYAFDSPQFLVTAKRGRYIRYQQAPFCMRQVWHNTDEPFSVEDHCWFQTGAACRYFVRLNRKEVSWVTVNTVAGCVVNPHFTELQEPVKLSAGKEEALDEKESEEAKEEKGFQSN